MGYDTALYVYSIRVISIVELASHRDNILLLSIYRYAVKK